MKKIISITLTICMLLANSVVFAKDYTQKFWDVDKSHWAFEYIADLADRGVINGYTDGSFKPTKTVTRAEWAKMMVDAAGVSVNDNNTSFNDMSNHWANKYVNAAKNYLTGYQDGTYRPDQAATREDVTVSMVKLKGYDLSEVDYFELNKFSDNDSISNNMKAYIAVAVGKGLIDGFEDNTFRGQATLTRAEAATLLYRAFQKGNDDKIADVSYTLTEPTNTQESNSQTINNEKPYVVETLCSASLTEPYLEYYRGNALDMFTSDNVSKVYFVENNVVYSVDTNGNKEKLFEASSLDYRDGFETKTTQIVNLCYDVYGKQLLIITTQNEGNKRNIYALKNGDNIKEVGVYPKLGSLWYGEICHNRMISVLSTGEYFSCEGHSDVYIGIESIMYGNYGPTVISAAESDDYLFFATGAGLYKYDYISEPQIFKNWGDWGLDALGLSSIGYALGKDGKFIKYTFNTDETEYIDNYTVKDKKPVNPVGKLFLMNNGDIVFFDNSETFRVLKKVS